MDMLEARNRLMALASYSGIATVKKAMLTVGYCPLSTVPANDLQAFIELVEEECFK